MRLVSIVCLLVVCVACVRRPASAPAEDVMIVLPPTLESGRMAMRSDIRDGQARLQTFAARWGWSEIAQEPFTRRYEIVADKSSFDARLAVLSGVSPETKFPPTFTAALEAGTFLSVSPDVYRSVFPEGDEPGAFSKLVTHELAHRLHVRLVEGREDRMGPIWFFEGFAVVAAEQFAADSSALDHDEVAAIVHATARGSYRRYGKLVRMLLRKRTLPELVARAGRDDFNGWVEGTL